MMSTLDDLRAEVERLRSKLERGHVCTAACRPQQHVAHVGRHALDEALAEVRNLRAERDELLSDQSTVDALITVMGCDRGTLVDRVAELLNRAYPNRDEALADIVAVKAAEVKPILLEMRPVVLSLDELPLGAVALTGVESGRRYEPTRTSSGAWRDTTTGQTMPYIRVMEREGSVTVEMPSRSKVGDKIKRGAERVPADVVQFVDRRYLRVWSQHPANPSGMWGSAQPSVAWDERHLLDECAPLVVTEVREALGSEGGTR